MKERERYDKVREMNLDTDREQYDKALLKVRELGLDTGRIEEYVDAIIETSTRCNLMEIFKRYAWFDRRLQVARDYNPQISAESIDDLVDTAFRLVDDSLLSSCSCIRKSSIGGKR